MTRTFAERLHAKILRDDRGCWLFTGSRTPNRGYGLIQYEGKLWLAHRASWTHSRGPIPDGMQIDHLCRVRRCVNPDHLEVVTPTENRHRRADYERETCHLGHSYQGEHYTSGARRCTVCRRASAQRGRDRNKLRTGGTRDGLPVPPR